MISLPALSLCYSGLTWYERVFSAQLADAEKNDAYRTLVEEQLRAADAKPSSFEAFCDEARVPTSSRDLLQPFYEQETTLMAFFAAARERLLHDEVNPFCKVVGPWVGGWIDARLRRLHRGTWVIRAEALDGSEDNDGVVRGVEVTSGDASWCCGRRVMWGAHQAQRRMLIGSEAD